jgi:hypothetical protein
MLEFLKYTPRDLAASGEFYAIFEINYGLFVELYLSLIERVTLAFGTPVLQKHGSGIS